MRYRERYPPETADEDLVKRCKRLVQSLVAQVRKGHHVGIPAVMSYIRGVPICYRSHSFASSQEVKLWRCVQDMLRLCSAADVPATPHKAAGTTYPPTMIPTSKADEYDWGPDALQNSPYYFFVAVTDVVLSVKDGVWAWRGDRDNDSGNVVGRHPCFANRALDARYRERSRTVLEEGSHSKAVLRDVDGYPIIWADQLRRLLLQKAWSIPKFTGRLPQTPDENTSAEEKTKFALFTMFLFLP